MEPEGVVLPTPAIGQALSLSHRGEQLSVQELDPEPAVECLGKSVLPRGAWLDVRHGVAAAFCSAPEVVGNELRPVVAAGEHRPVQGRCW